MNWQELPFDRIYFDSINGVPGTTWPIGTPTVPSDVIADVITMCADRNIHTIQVHGALTLAATMQHYNFVGYEHEDVADVISLGGQDVDGSHISGMLVAGAQGGANFLTIIRCIINAVTNFQGQMNRCSFWGGATSTFKDGGYIDLIDCESIYGAVTITVQAPTRASIKNWRGNLILTAQDGGICNVRGFKGTLEIDAMTAGTLSVYANGADITINADCTGGTINIYGNARVTDNSAAGCTVNDYSQETQLDAVEALVEAKVMGRLQIKATTIELNQAVGAKDLFTGTGQDVVIEKLTIRIPVDVSGGAMTSLSIQTDDTTNQVFISAADGVKANLTAQAQLGWTGVTLLKATKKIQLTIAGAATGIACSCDVIAECRAVVSGGHLA